MSLERRFLLASIPAIARVAPVWLAAALVLGACQHGAEAPAAAPASADEPVRSAPVTAESHMVVAANPFAADAGLEILKAGGSAVDAAIAAQMVLGLVEPQSSGLGGGGFLLHHSAASGEVAAYDGRETAPAAATPDMFLDEEGEPRRFHEAAVGGLAVGVPGLLRMLEMAHKDHGRLPWKDLFVPAIRLAMDGFPIPPRLHALAAKDGYLRAFGTSAAYFLDSDHNAKAVGETLTNQPLAKTLTTIAETGAGVFYEGDMAEDLVSVVRHAEVNPGRLTAADLKAYRAKKREPACLSYRIWLICGMPPPSSGSVTTLQILGILRNEDLAALEPNSEDAVHLITEASKLAYADRDTYIADPDFIPVPTAGLLDPGYLVLRAKEMSPKAMRGKAFPGMPGIGGAWNFGPGGGGREGYSTTHLSVIDKDGNAVSMTSSIEQAFGSHLMVGGFLLNNQLTDFDFRPERGGAPTTNRAEPGKRPRSSMAPTLVLDETGEVVMATGSPGGARIIGYVAQSLIAALDWNLGAQETVNLPHFTNRNWVTELEQGTDLEDLAPALEARGHEVRLTPMTSGLHVILRRDGKLTGGADPRRDGISRGE